MNINPNSRGFIAQLRAIELVNAFSAKLPSQVVTSFFEAKNAENIHIQIDGIGIRIYSGCDTIEEQISLVLIGVDSDGKDILRNGIIDNRVETYFPKKAKNSIFS
jgi:hypothetical protein